MAAGNKTVYEWPEIGGVVRFKTVRTDHADGTKTFIQFHRETATAEWVAKAPPWPRPVWRLDELSWLDDGSPVLVVEGEKTAIAAQALFGDRLFVTTWAGGSNAVAKTDWAPLKRHRVVVWPDLDRKCFPDDHANACGLMPFMMQPGTKAALQVVAATGGALVDIPDAFIEDTSWVVPSGWDLADELPQDWSLTDVETWIRKAFEALKPNPPVLAIAAPQAEPGQNGERSNGDHVPAVDEIEFGSEAILITNANGAPKPCYENVVRIMETQRKWDITFDEFGNRPLIDGEGMKAEHLMVIARAVQSAGLVAGTNVIAEGVVGAAQSRRVHPIRDYLDGLKWDGIERLPTWLIDHAGAVDTEYVRAVSERWMIQAIARVRQPACQADATLILEGEQGIRKSTVLRTLFSPWFTDHLPDLTQKDAMVQLLGMWCIEVAEMSTFNRAEAAEVKRFLTRTTDRYRPPYGRGAEDYPRQCVFAGTVNPGAMGYFKDPTGGRRFWPVECTTEVNVEAVRAARDQLWAEADAKFARGNVWWLTEPSLIEAAQIEQEARREDDAWENRVTQFVSARTRTSVGEVLDQALGMPKASDWTVADQQRVGRILSALKWKRKQARVDGVPKWFWVNPRAKLLGGDHE